jgi:hypothetical protein
VGRTLQAYIGTGKPRDVFAFIICEGKVRGSDGAVALMERCK